MYFSNLTNKKEFKRSNLKGLKRFEVLFEDSIVDTVGFYSKGDTLYASNKDLGSEYKSHDIGELHFTERDGCKYTANELKDTEESPLIWVLAKSFRVYSSVETYIKYITLDDNYVLVCLVYGSIGFKADGVGKDEEVGLSRCVDVDIANSRSKLVKGSDLFVTCVNRDAATGYNLQQDSINGTIFAYKPSGSLTVKNLKSVSTLLSEEGLQNEKVKLEQIKKREEEKKEKMLKLRKEAEKFARDVKKEEEEELETGYRTVSNGAALFMDAVASL